MLELVLTVTKHVNAVAVEQVEAMRLLLRGSAEAEPVIRVCMGVPVCMCMSMRVRVCIFAYAYECALRFRMSTVVRVYAWASDRRVSPKLTITESKAQYVPCPGSAWYLHALSLGTVSVFKVRLCKFSRQRTHKITHTHTHAQVNAPVWVKIQQGAVVKYT